jgi:small subunit ribosomal protein S12
MVTFSQLKKVLRIPKYRRIRHLHLGGAPQVKAVCMRFDIHKPKKPNSARRKVIKIHVNKVSKKTFCYIPGIGHTLQKYSRVLVRGGRRPDLPGSKYSAIRGVYDLGAVRNRVKARSRYGVKNFGQIRLREK